MPRSLPPGPAQQLLNAIHALDGMTDEAIAAHALDGQLRLTRSAIARYRGGSREVPADLLAIVLAELPAEDAHAALDDFRRSYSNTRGRGPHGADRARVANEAGGRLAHLVAIIVGDASDQHISDEEALAWNLNEAQGRLDNLKQIQMEAERNRARRPD